MGAASAETAADSAKAAPNAVGIKAFNIISCVSVCFSNGEPFSRERHVCRREGARLLMKRKENLRRHAVQSQAARSGPGPRPCAMLYFGFQCGSSTGVLTAAISVLEPENRPARGLSVTSPRVAVSPVDG
jgi:hypothetical protein